MLHKISEWDDKKPFNVEFTAMKLENGEVKRVCGYEVNTHVVLTYDHRGHAYCVVNTTDNVMLKVDEDGECEKMNFDELLMLLPVPQSDYDIKW